MGAKRFNIEQSYSNFPNKLHKQLILRAYEQLTAAKDVN